MIDLQTLKDDVKERRRSVDLKVAEHGFLNNHKDEIVAEMLELNEVTLTLDKVTILLNSIGEDRQQEAQEKIEGIVTRGLQAIFGNTFSFHIIQSMRGKNASVEFYIRTYLDDKVLETPVLESHGGGLAAVVGLLLRITIILLQKEETTAKVLVLDESTSMVSANYIDPLAEFLTELIKKTGLQVILVTHQPEWESYADKTYTFGIKNGATYVKEQT